MAPSSPLLRVLALLLCLYGSAAALEEERLNFVLGLDSVLTPKYTPHPS
jgi:hypothetical protein